MEKTVYLIGAGASAGVLPTTASMPDHLFWMVNHIWSEYQHWRKENPDEKVIDESLGFSRDYAFRQLHGDLLWLHSECKRHASVDTLAKKAYLTKNNKLLARVKSALIGFLFLKQILNEADPRYDAFLASILNAELEIPSHIKVVSWNYDFQFEKAFSAYLNSNYLSESEIKLGVVPKFGVNRVGRIRSIFKINGVTDVIHPSGTIKLYGTLRPPEDMKYFYGDFANSYYSSAHNENYKMGLSFAWEDDQIIELAKKEAFDPSNILVIIGLLIPIL